MLLMLICKVILTKKSRGYSTFSVLNRASEAFDE